jgi:hypothetical protein
MNTEVNLDIAESGADAERIERLTLGLREELLALDVVSVTQRSGGEAPAGTRGLDVAAVGALVVSISPALKQLGGMVAAVTDWLKRTNSSGTVKVTIGSDQIELTGGSSKSEQELIKHWVETHSGS